MIQHQTSLSYYAVLLFTVDIFFYALLNQQLIQSLSCGFIIALLLDTRHSMFPFAISSCLLDMVYSGRCGFSLLTMLPLMFMRSSLQKHLTTEATRTPFILWSIYYLLQSILLWIINPGQKIAIIYTIFQYCANIIVLFGCLKIYKKGWLDNRF